LKLLNMEYIAPQSIERTHFLGQGSESEVLHGKHKFEDVCLKGVLFNDKNFGFNSVLDWVNHCDMMCQFKSSKLMMYKGCTVDQGSLYDIYEYVPHGTISELVQKDVDVSSAKLRRVAEDILIGLNYLHSLNLVYCDLKPSNILVSNKTLCNVKICDYGSVIPLVSSSNNPQLMDGAVIVGKNTKIRSTQMYMAPESLKQGIFSSKSDIYSFGKVMYFLTARRLPMNGSIDLQRVKSDELRALIAWCLSENAHERPSAVQAIHALGNSK